MKNRSGFVSNSSSSSFIVIGSKLNNSMIKSLREAYGNRSYLEISADLGCHEFGWENTKYSSFWDKVMFAFIQADYMRKEHPNWMFRLEKVLKDTLNVQEIFWGISTDWERPDKDKQQAYIDHQSASTEDNNIEMFESDEAMMNFLFSTGSYIQGGNDNE